VFSLLLIIFISGCKDVDLSKVSKEDINKVIACEPPYMRYASECCLDANTNKICDRDEGTTPTTQTTPTTAIGKISDEVFGTADTTISKLHTGARLTLPTSVDVKQGEVVRLNAFVGNDGTRCTVNTFTLTPTLNTGSSTEIGVKLISPNSITIKPGEEGTFVIGVAATKTAPLATGSINDPSVSVTVSCGSEVYDTSAFTINVQKGSDETSNTDIRCATEVDFKISNVCVLPSNGGYKVTIENNQGLKIDKLVVRFYQAVDNMQATDMFKATGIGGYGISSETFTPTPALQVKFVEAIPVVTIGGKSVTCAANRQDFGSLDGAQLDAC
jgi:hypothetical protein